MKRFSVIVLGSLLVTGLLYSAFAEELTITTYYPAPYGVYKTLRLYPHADFNLGDSCTNEGEMYYDSDDDKIYICSGDAGFETWQSVAGGGSYLTYKTSCAWIKSLNVYGWVSWVDDDCIPPACADSDIDLGISNMTTAVDAGDGQYGNLNAASAGISYRNCRTSGSYMYETRCSWIKSLNTYGWVSWAIDSCTPPACQNGDDDLGIYNEVFSVTGGEYGNINAATAGSTYRVCIHR